MTDWAVHLRVDVGDRLTDDLMDTLLDDLGPTHDAALAGNVGGSLSVQLTVTDQHSPTAALAAAWKTVDRALAAAGVPAMEGDLLAVEVMTTAEQDRQLSAPPVPPLVGPVDAAEILGITRQRVHILRRGPGFPAPVPDAGTSGPLWRRSDIEDYAATRVTTPGRPMAGSRLA